MEFGYEKLEAWIAGNENAGFETAGKEIASMVKGLVKALSTSK